jgi:CheY-like chemotaxis protein
MIRPSATLLASTASWKGIAWNVFDRRLQRCTFKEILRASTSESFGVMPLERIVIEGKLESRDFLVLLSTLHPSFTGDVLYIDRPDRAFLSATADGGARVMYTLSKADIDFYVDVNDLRRRSEESSFHLISDSANQTTKPRATQVLIVEDDPKTLRSMTSVLSGLGCQTLIAQSDIDAIPLVGQRRPDVVLLRGGEVARFVKSAYSEYRPRTIIVSAGERKPESGVDGFLERPLAFDQIGTALFGDQTAEALAT